jgi:hypothetical protein
MNRLLGIAEISERLEQALFESDDVYVPPGVNRQVYLSGIADDIRAHRCEPTLLTATVMAPAFPDVAEGDSITAMCVAKRDGYWLVYDHQRDRFCSFWGENPEMLGAHGVYGSPSYCWTA